MRTETAETADKATNREKKRPDLTDVSGNRVGGTEGIASFSTATDGWLEAGTGESRCFASARMSMSEGRHSFGEMTVVQNS